MTTGSRSESQPSWALRPNIVLITSDQQRGDCFGFEGRRVRTPHLDDLARAGTRFAACITPNLVCQPSRASILTGLLPLTHGVYIYSTDHGEMLGEHGLWWKSAMYESAVAVPLIVAGPDVPAGRVVGANAMLVDIFPSILEAVGEHPSPEDRDLSLPNRVMITTRVLGASRS